MTTAIPRSSHASIITGSTSDPFRQSYYHHKHSTSIGTNTSSIRNQPYNKHHSTLNPFDIIYTDEDFTTNKKSPNKSSTTTNIDLSNNPSIPLHISQNQWHSSRNYNLISHNISTGGSINMLKDSINNSSNDTNLSRQIPNPIVTLIDPLPKRSGSMVSRSATLRNRYKIKSRNKTIKRKDIHEGFIHVNGNNNNNNNAHVNTKDPSPPTSPTSSKKPSSTSKWPKFIFPVLRKKSLKYQSITKQIPNFKSENQFQNYINSTNYNNKILSLLPSTMKMWNYTEQLHPHPLLNYKSIHTTKFESKNHTRSNSINLIDQLYSSYRLKVFQLNQNSNNQIPKKYQKIPPKFQKLYPKDSILLTKKELHQLNLKILVEILLRRTVAAKMEYRLKNNGVNFTKQQQTSSIFSSSSSSSSSLSSSTMSDTNTQSSSSSTSSNHQQHQKDHQSSFSNSSKPYNNDDILLQNQSMFEDLLMSNSNPSYTNSPKENLKTKKKPTTSPKNQQLQQHIQSKAYSFSSSKYSDSPPIPQTNLMNPFSLDPKSNTHTYSTHQNINTNSSLLLSSISNPTKISLQNSITSLTKPPRKSINTSNTSNTSLNSQEMFMDLSPKSHLDDLINDFQINVNEFEQSKKNGFGFGEFGKLGKLGKLGNKKIIPYNIIEPDQLIRNMNDYDLYR
ncbi:hypothetical protein KGF54_000105 [Candida jiufengensis]|uniref:uncharacterized protein n=1 Tax=Candida jiufengensis TaxID=497108 RepID=UPI002225914D|nr:uncharacterized protein KGF54_000105 [Candida jiufengensis]KAI5957177.1 hypothetical protein KGF54_000105 [Candida jiufengensis]